MRAFTAIYSSQALVFSDENVGKPQTPTPLFLEMDGVPVKFEIVREARIELGGAIDASLGVPVLAREDMYAEKLLANADRFNDPAVASRDIIDLAMMISRWGPVPADAWHKVRRAYGKSVESAYQKAIAKVSAPTYLQRCLATMQMDRDLADTIVDALAANSDQS